jgi:hypothetical protein
VDTTFGMSFKRNTATEYNLNRITETRISIMKGEIKSKTLDTQLRAATM